MESLRTELFSTQRNSDQGSFRVQSYNNHPLNPSAPEFNVSATVGNPFQSSFFTTSSMLTATPTVTADSPALPLAGILPPTSRSQTSAPMNTPEWIAPEKIYDAVERQLREEYTSRCLECKEHMIVVFNLDPKTSKKELGDIFYPTGAADSIIFDSKGPSTLRRKYGVVFFPHKDFALRAVEKINNFAPQRQTQLLVVRYCGPDPPVASQGSLSRNCTITDSDLGVLVNLLNESDLVSSQTPGCTLVSLHGVEQSSIDRMLTIAQEKTQGVVLRRSWSPPSSYTRQSSETMLSNAAIRTAVLNFPSRSLASSFVADVEQEAKAVNVALRGAILGRESRKIDAAPSVPVSFPLNLGSPPPPPPPPPFGVPTNAYPSLRLSLGLGGNPVSSLPVAPAPLPPYSANYFTDPGLMQLSSPFSAFGAVDFKDDTSISGSSPSLSKLLTQASAVAVGVKDVRPIGAILKELINHPEFSMEMAREVSKILGEIVKDPHRADTLRSVLWEMIFKTPDAVPSGCVLENRNALFKTVGTDMLNLVVYKGFLQDASRKVAGEIAVYCFLRGFLPHTPPRFAVCALNRFEKTLQSERQDSETLPMSDPSTVVTIVRVLQLMVDSWGSFFPSDDPDIKEFTKMKKVVLGLCDNGSVLKERTETKRQTAELTPSARPTPRPVRVMISPSSGGSNRRETFHTPGAGLTPTAKLGQIDAENGSCGDKLTETNLSNGSGSRKRCPPEYGEELRHELRVECTLFVSSVPGKLTHPQIRRLLLHFGDINKVRVKSKGKRAHVKVSTTVNVFVEFRYKEGAKAMAQYFANVADRDFSFLRTPSTTGVDDFTEDDIHLLYGISAVKAKSEIRGPHQSDAVYDTGAMRLPRDDRFIAPDFERITDCTFGLEESTIDSSSIPGFFSDAGRHPGGTDEEDNSLLPNANMKEIPPAENADRSNSKERPMKNVDMDDLLNAIIKEAYGEKEDFNLDFSAELQTASPFIEKDSDEYTNLNASFLLENS